MEIVKKQLTPDEIQPAGTRFNTTEDTVQLSPDGGTTWINAPDLDPRHNTAYQLPPRGGSDPQCDAAANMVAKLQSMVSIFEAEISQFQAASGLLAIILVFFGGAGLIIDLLLAIADLLVTIGASAISAAFTSDQWGLILCILDCNIEGDGTVTEADLAQIIYQIYTQCSTVVYDVMFFLLPTLGEVGLTNAGASGTETGDCSDCDCGWCFEVDLATDDFGITRPSLTYGTWVSGIGWRSDTGSSEAIYLHKTFTATRITHVEIQSVLAVQPTGVGAGNYVAVRHSGSNVHVYTQSASVFYANQLFVLTFDDTIDEILFNPSGSMSGGNRIWMTHLKIKGYGACPFGTPNCDF